MSIRLAHVVGDGGWPMSENGFSVNENWVKEATII